MGVLRSSGSLLSPPPWTYVAIGSETPTVLFPRAFITLDRSLTPTAAGTLITCRIDPGVGRTFHVDGLDLSPQGFSQSFNVQGYQAISFVVPTGTFSLGQTGENDIIFQIYTDLDNGLWTFYDCTITQPRLLPKG
jgi:hypothetical protein